MRDNFIYRVGGFVRNRDLASLGEGLHSVLDTYLEVQTRVDMMNSYSYTRKSNIITGMYVAPYVYNQTPCIEAVKYIYNALKGLGKSATDAQIGDVFDRWVVMANGGDDPMLRP